MMRDIGNLRVQWHDDDRAGQTLQGQQEIPALQALPGLRPGDDLAQALGQDLGAGEVLFGCLPEEGLAVQRSSGKRMATRRQDNERQ
jgi:hypothetical protein